MHLFVINYSGNLYHRGEHSNTIPSYTQGDYITAILDVDNKTLSFGKNGEEPTVAFQDVEAAELFPCVLFYSTNPGEKVFTFYNRVFNKT
jgi:E3 ubiquitin-protein ligase HERC1